MAWLVEVVLNWLKKQLVAAYEQYKKAANQHKERVNRAGDNSKKAERLKPDSKAEEVDEAIDDQLSDL